MDYAALVAELKAGDYAIDAAKGVTVDRAREIAASLNKPRQTGTRLRKLSTEEVLDAIGEAGEIAKIEDENKNEAVALAAYLYGAGGVNMAVGSYGRTLLQAVIGAAAFARVVAAATEPVMQSWAEQHGVEPVGDGHVLSVIELMGQVG